MIPNFHEEIKIVPILSHASGSADRTSEVIDTHGFERCCVVVHFAAIAAGATTSLKLQHGEAATDENTITSPADVVGSAQTVADTDDNGVKYIDLHTNERYLQLIVDKDAVNATAESAIAYLYVPDETPVAHAAGTSSIGDGVGAVAGEFITHAVDGTA